MTGIYNERFAPMSRQAPVALFVYNRPSHTEELCGSDFSDAFRDNTKSALILLLECLYYLRDGERTQCLVNLGNIFPHAQIAISSPIIGPPYLTEQELKALTEKIGYRCRAVHVLNFRRGSSLLFAHAIGDKIGFLRRALANQVVYIFARKGMRAAP